MNSGPQGDSRKSKCLAPAERQRPAWSDTLDPSLVPLWRAYPRMDLGNLAVARQTVGLLTSAAARSPRWADAATEVVVRDLALATERPSGPVPVRVYQPANGPTAKGAVLFFHGGAFVMGDLNTEHRRCLSWSSAVPCTVVSVDYRLAPEHPFPAAVVDAMDAYDAVLSGAGGVLSAGRSIVVAGTSAGAALAAAVATLRRDLGRSAPAGQVLVYPVLDNRLTTTSMVSFVDTPGWDFGNSVWMWRYYLPDPLPDAVYGSPCPSLAYAAPGRVDDLAGLPSTCVITAGLDPLRDEGIGYAQRLMHAGVTTELRNFGRAFHGFDAIGGIPLADSSLELQASMLRDLMT